MSIDLTLRQFVKPFHQGKDPAHDIKHIQRLQFTAKQIGEMVHIEPTKVKFALYFHGLNENQKQKLSNFMHSYGFEPEQTEYFVNLEKYTDRMEVPLTKEEKLIHDTHILEGGPDYALVKSIITGSHRGQTIEFTLNHFEKKILRRNICYFDETKRLLREQQANSTKIINSLREYLPYSV